MNFLYSAMWLGIAIFLFILGAKEDKLYSICGIYFIFNSIWWFIDALGKYDMFNGTIAWIYRGITALFLVVGICYYLFVYKKKKEKDSDTNRS